MISKLKGRIDTYGPDWVVIDVNGVGYHCFCSTKTLSVLPAAGEFGELFTEMLVSQDMIRLVGFATQGEREWFKLLQTVQGVGTKVALALLSTLSTAELAQAIALQDKAMVARAPGVGPKVAQRIVSELKDKAPAFAPADPALAKLQAEIGGPKPTAASDAVSALVNLGYGQSQAGAAVSAAMRKAGDDAATEQLIRLALKELALA
ncbi:Holliday junction branch migration protein RuvA [Aestuariivirga sp. YIM B02566]|uniref:Holliday junction branch migration protein RuvA n=1 Tax=Taklimakanibacter albus TaxID=2800327 RepID=A0ACC5R5X5_9HYPH|nr:Holliday junction branch migration protein RuvA [Aestuariivirga sp. YIM B02566]MBK1867773.1 Holliday junction branch migration protein RuvA [Aestuariivirga sp. YIM B02566]